MASATINWTPSTGSNTLSQEVQYKKASSSTWIVFSTVGSNITTANITGLDNNVIYNFRIVSDCNFGGPSPSAAYSTIIITCPTVTITPSNSSADFSFSLLGESLTAFSIVLYDSTGTNILDTKNINYTTAQPITGTFNNLIPSTSYKYRMTVSAGSYSKLCPFQDFTTQAPPVCDPPSNVIATLSA